MAEKPSWMKAQAPVWPFCHFLQPLEKVLCLMGIRGVSHSLADTPVPHQRHQAPWRQQLMAEKPLGGEEVEEIQEGRKSARNTHRDFFFLKVCVLKKQLDGRVSGAGRRSQPPSSSSIVNPTL